MSDRVQKRRRPMPSIEALNRAFRLDAAKGKLYWRESRGCIHAGDEAGFLSRSGYRLVGVDGGQFMSHRVIFAMANGYCHEDLDIDHINCRKSDNRPENLREATRAQNSANKKLVATNTSGRKGVYWHAGGKKWAASIRVNGQQLYIGLFTDIEEAAQAYLSAAEKHFGEFARADSNERTYESH